MDIGFGVLALSGIAAAPPVAAKPAEVRISVDRELDFGSFMVFGNARRSVAANGAVTDDSIVALEGTIPAPAQFTVTYDRGNANRHVLDVEVELYISPASAVRIGGVEGRLSSYETDLPGARRVTGGQPIRISIPNCRTRTCSVTFRLGATLDVSRQYGGARLVVPIPVDAVLVSDDRQRR
ncbi:DUF4402 domain-containing protein [Qipengyuania sp. JC766]|uniref:DUF4402 domain-containing protein n=1 Tax=Qipengyuania sp. JC766 TaxID=3232139 RepID=UPI003458E778